MDFFMVLKDIGIVISVITGISAVYGLVGKKVNKEFKTMIKDENEQQNEKTNELFKQMQISNTTEFNKIHDELAVSKEATVASLRHSITKIFEENKSERKLTEHTKQDLCSLYEQYRKLGGNSYICSLFEEMNKWETK